MFLKTSITETLITLEKKREIHLERISQMKEGYKVSCVNILIGIYLKYFTPHPPRD